MNGLRTIGLILSFSGTLLLVWPLASNYISYQFDAEKRKSIEDAVTSQMFNRLAPEKREDQLSDPSVKAGLRAYTNGFWGLVLFFLGFLIQVVAIWWPSK